MPFVFVKSLNVDKSTFYWKNLTITKTCLSNHIMANAHAWLNIRNMLIIPFKCWVGV